MPAEPTVAVFGAGAVGGYLGGKLAARPDLDVSLIGRPPLVESVRARGLILRENGMELATHPHVTASAGSLPPCDLVMLTVKTYDVPSAMEDVRRLLGDDGMLLAMQNGVGTEEVLGRDLGRSRVLVGTLTARTDVAEPGVVDRRSRRGGVALATMDGNPVPEWVVDAFETTGLPTVVVEDYRSLRWSKLLLNLLGAATTAILDVDMTAVVGDPRLFRIEQLAFREASRVVAARRIQIVALPGYPVPVVRMLMRLPAPPARRLLGPRLAGARGGRAPGMREDIRRGRTEVAWLNGAVVSAGRQAGVQTPVNAALTELVEKLAGDERERERYRGRTDRLVASLLERSVRID